MSRRASLDGMTFGTNKNHIVRAALEYSFLNQRCNYCDGA
jgi:glycerol kinase